MRLVRVVVILLGLLGLTSGCGLWSDDDFYQYRSVTYFAVVVGAHDSVTVHFTDTDGIHEEPSGTTAFQTTVTGRFREALGLDLQATADLERKGNTTPVFPPTIRCGIAVDGTMYSEETFTNYTAVCHVDFADVTTPPRAAPPKPAGGGSSWFTPVLWLAAVVVVVVFTARWAFLRQRKSAAASGSPRQDAEPRTVGYEPDPHFRFMVRCGLVGLVGFVIVLVVSVLFQPLSTSSTPIPSVTKVPPGLTQPRTAPPSPTSPTGR
ncbi:hypothetical protein [Amycolatopsis sp. NPDC098790]|uniref:hypothetical protein n=1 Tax=Amycolatopsis sp. NPDC098790 TaxID=3363939 RepID=UPI0037F341F3